MKGITKEGTGEEIVGIGMIDLIAIEMIVIHGMIVILIKKKRGTVVGRIVRETAIVIVTEGGIEIETAKAIGIGVTVAIETVAIIAETGTERGIVDEKPLPETRQNGNPLVRSHLLKALNLIKAPVLKEQSQMPLPLLLDFPRRLS